MVVDQAASVQEARTAVEKHHPDLVFLDINMPTGDGFSLLNGNTDSFKVIFVTAYDRYATKAFRYSALDYLMKPINIDHLTEAVGKFNNTPATSQSTLDALRYFQQKMTFDKIILPVGSGYQFVQIDKIIRVEADGNYSKVYFPDTEPLLISRALHCFEETLNHSDFIRIHRAHLININYVTFFDRNENIVKLSDGSSVYVSVRRKNSFIQRLSEFTLGTGYP